ncbi:MAG: Gmad2 immunoglobulin-like domain-containing protein [Candidatus Levybacteria bacterium]|nr:Gmad2 immunoglobulin-like domain-containing protein [Candidatus Levybacteria bacterium]
MKTRVAVGIAAVFIVLLVAFVLVRGNEDNWLCQNGVWVKHGNPTVPSPTGICGTPTPSISQASENISIDSPKAKTEVSVPFVIKGQARVFENQFSYKILDGSGNIVLEGSAYADAKDAGQFGPYEITVSGLSLKGKITLQVFNYSAKDGRQENKVTIPLVLK